MKAPLNFDPIISTNDQKAERPKDRKKERKRKEKEKEEGKKNERQRTHRTSAADCLIS